MSQSCCHRGDRGEDYLFSLGVPGEWMDAVLAATDSNLLDLLNHQPEEARWPLLELACGDPVRRPSAPQSAAESTPTSDPFLHADVQPHFRVIESEEQLRQSLDKAWSRSSVVPDKDAWAEEYAYSDTSLRRRTAGTPSVSPTSASSNTSMASSSRTCSDVIICPRTAK
jgi:hypothetical protein